MGERLVLILLVVGAFVLLGLWLRSGSLLDWFTTVAVTTATAFFGNALRGTPLDARRPPSDSSRFGPLIDALAAHPLLKYLTTNLALRVIASIAFAVAVATFEQGVTSLLFGASELPPIVKGIFGLALVLLPTYFLLGLVRIRRDYQQSPWIAQVLQALAHAVGLRVVELTPMRRVVVWSLLTTLGAVIMRVVAVLLFPSIFGNYYALGFFALILIALLLGGETIFAVFRNMSGIATSSHAGPNSERNPS